MDNPIYLEDSEKKKLLPELTGIANRAFGSTLSEKEVEEHVFPVSTLLLAEAGNKIAGFSASSHYHLRDTSGEYALVYLVGVGIDPEFQEAGLYDSLIKQRIDIEIAKAGASRVFITTRTQNPRVYGSVRKYLESIFPNEEFFEAQNKVEEYRKELEGKKAEQIACGYDVGCGNYFFDMVRNSLQNKYREYFKNEEAFRDLLEKAREMARILKCEVNERGVVKGAYGSSKYPTLPKYKDEAVNKMFERELDISKGDGFIIVGKSRAISTFSTHIQSENIGGFGQVMNVNGEPHFPCGF